MEPSGRRTFARVLPAVVVGIAIALPLVELWRAPGPPMEEGFMLVFPELVADGRVPNRDFLHLYGPGSLWVLAGAFRAFGTTLATERAIGVLQLAGVAFGILAATRRWGPAVAATGGVLAAVVVVPPIGLTALAWVGAVAFGLWSLVSGFAGADASTDRSARARAVLVGGAGFLAGAALLYRPDLIVAVGASGLVVWTALDRAGRIRYLVGAALGVVPYLFHIARAGLGNVIDGLIIEPVFDLRGGRRLPLPPSWGEFDGFLQRAGLLIEPPWPLPAPPSPAQLSLWLGLLLAANVVLVVAGVRAARRGERLLLALALFSVGLLPQALQRADSTHLAWVSCVPFGLLPAAVADLVRTWRPSWKPRATAAVAIAVPVVATLVLVPHFTWRTYADYVARSFELRDVAAGTIRRGDREFPYGRLDAVDAVHAMIPDVERVSEPGDSLFVGTGDLRKTPYSEAFLYYLFPELPPATRYIEMDPGVANAVDSGLADELRAADIVILSSIRDDWDEPNDSRDFGPNEPNEVIAEEFCAVGSYGVGLFGRGLYELYERCDDVGSTAG
ncbi:MAG TPA: hypothetical protein VFZ83_04770 [Acidimicrobiia bacterium]|nr:hypothetical protein [Acidimicrobiia bacterium]